MATDQKDQAPSVAQSTREVLGVEEKPEDKDELTSTDFSNAATDLQDKVAGAIQYVADSLSPATNTNEGHTSAQGGAENDPEVQEFRKSAAEAVEGVKKAVEPREGFTQGQQGSQASISDAAGAVKEKVLPTAKAAGPDPKAEEAKEDAKGALQQAADSVKEGASYISNRFTAPASGDKETDRDAKDKVKETADKAADKADHATSKADKKTDEAGQSIGDAAQEAKNSVANSASYIADRFSAPATGDKGTDQKGKEKAEEAKEKSTGFLSGILPKSNVDDKGTSKGDGKSLGDKAHNQYESAKAEVNKTQDSIADQITPHNSEEAALSAGYIPSNTAAEK